MPITNDRPLAGQSSFAYDKTGARGHTRNLAHVVDLLALETALLPLSGCQTDPVPGILSTRYLVAAQNNRRMKDCVAMLNKGVRTLHAAGAWHGNVANDSADDSSHNQSART